MKIEVTKEEYEAFKNGDSITLIPPKKEYVIEYDKAFKITGIDDKTLKRYNNSSKSYDICEGMYRKTKENAGYSHKRNQQGNLLEALVEDLQGELGIGNWGVYHNNNIQFIAGRTHDMSSPGFVVMKEQTAEKVCELLNSGQYSLDV